MEDYETIGRQRNRGRELDESQVFTIRIAQIQEPLPASPNQSEKKSAIRGLTFTFHGRAGLETRAPGEPAAVAKITSACPPPSSLKVASLGLEPRITESKSVVLPLHYEAFCLRRAQTKPACAVLATWKIGQCDEILTTFSTLASARVEIHRVAGMGNDARMNCRSQNVRSMAIVSASFPDGSAALSRGNLRPSSRI